MLIFYGVPDRDMSTDALCRSRIGAKLNKFTMKYASMQVCIMRITMKACHNNLCDEDEHSAEQLCFCSIALLEILFKVSREIS